jgi:hypothetical protein
MSVRFKTILGIRRRTLLIIVFIQPHGASAFISFEGALESLDCVLICLEVHLAVPDVEGKRLELVSVLPDSLASLPEAILGLLEAVALLSEETTK